MILSNILSSCIDLRYLKPDPKSKSAIRHALSKTTNKIKTLNHVYLLLPRNLCLLTLLRRLLQLQLGLELSDLQLEPLVLGRAHVLTLHVVQPGCWGIERVVTVHIVIISSIKMITMIDIITSDLSLHTVLAACCVRPPESGLLLLDPRIFIMMMSER